VSVIAEQFKCPPDVAARQDLAECMTILRLRDYRDAKEIIEHASDDDPRKQAVSESPTAAIWNEVMHVKKRDEKVTTST